MARLSRRRFEARKPWPVFEDCLDTLKIRLRQPLSLDLAKPERSRSEHRYKGDKAWRGSVIDLSKWPSDDDASVFSDASDDISNVALPSAAHVSQSTKPQITEDAQNQMSSFPSPSTAGTFENSSLNLCHQCAGINLESLITDLGYEHKLLSELPSRDQLRHLNDWDKSASTRPCKLCLVFMNGFREEDIAELNHPDKFRLFIHLEGIEKEDIHDQDHSDLYSLHCIQNKRNSAGRSTSRLFLGLMHVDAVKDYAVPGFDIGSYGFYFFHRGSRGFHAYHRLHCFTNMDDASVPFGVVPVRPIGNSTSSAASFEVAAAWLSQCLDTDLREATVLPGEQVSMCPAYLTGTLADDDFRLEFDDESAPGDAYDSSNPERPTRLLEIGSGPEAGMVRLTENDKDEVPVPYATLSYCWGQRPQNEQCEWLTTMGNVHSRRAGIPRSDLPQTLQDSITIAERLGIKHIWIDSLCIIQDSDDDWASEAAKMGEIYLGSIVTIVAASSKSAEHGCFNQRSVSTIQSLHAQNELVSFQVSFKEGLTGNLHIITRPYQMDVAFGGHQDIENLYKHEVNRGPWIDRGWTLQEHLFSRRILFYTDRMLLWECNHCRLSEDRQPQIQGGSLYPRDILGSGGTRGSNYGAIQSRQGTLLTAHTWYSGLVEDYTRRQMTFGRDKLNAVGALAKATSWNRRIVYLAGLWGDSFRFGLMWLRDGSGTKIKTSTCPSWSWASQSSAVSYRLLRGSWPSTGIAAPQVLDVHVDPFDKKNPFGEVQSGYFMLQTKAQMARVLPDFLGLSPALYTYDNPFGHEGPRGLIIGSGTVMSLWPVKAYMDDDDVRYDEVLIAVVGACMSTTIALLLHPPRIGAQEYRRVGIALLEFDWDCEGQLSFGMPSRSEGEIAQWPTRTIKIV